MKKGYHKLEWFLKNVHSVILNLKTNESFFVQDRNHAKQLFLIQNLNNMKYVKK